MDPEKLGCSICLDLLRDPVTIPCGHSYCLSCIRSYWDEGDRTEAPSCPQCRQTFSPKPDLVRNTVMADLVEELKKTKTKTKTETKPRPGDVFCDFCTGRKVKAVKSCLQCLVSSCDQHLQPHRDVAALKKHKLVDASENLEENMCSRHNEAMKIFCRSDRRCICYLCLLDEHKGHDTVSAAAERKEKQRELEATREEIRRAMELLQKEITELRRRNEELETLSRTDDDVRFLRGFFDLGAVKSPETSDKPSAESDDEISRRRDDLEPKTREEFLGYSCQITPDPNTAHRFIALDNGVKVYWRNYRSEAPVHPDRFTSWYQVLCRESLTGRHYCEVEWKGENMFIAVSSIDISRTGPESAFGHNTKSWALKCSSDGFEFRHDGVRTPVSGPWSSRIGVYLDHKAGVLCFLSISDTATLLHRVQASFSRPLCLGFGLHNNESSAEICDLSKA